jgi:hypothetical protein
MTTDPNVQRSLDLFDEVETWTDDEWLEVIKRFPPETPVEVANEYIKAKRADK